MESDIWPVVKNKNTVDKTPAMKTLANFGIVLFMRGGCWYLVAMVIDQSCQCLGNVGQLMSQIIQVLYNLTLLPLWGSFQMY